MRPVLVDLVDLAGSRLGEERRAVGHQDGAFAAPQAVFHDRDLCSRRDDAGNRGRDGFGRRWRRRGGAATALGGAWAYIDAELSAHNMTTAILMTASNSQYPDFLVLVREILPLRSVHVQRR